MGGRSLSILSFLTLQYQISKQVHIFTKIEVTQVFAPCLKPASMQSILCAVSFVQEMIQTQHIKSCSLQQHISSKAKVILWELNYDFKTCVYGDWYITTSIQRDFHLWQLWCSLLNTVCGLMLSFSSLWAKWVKAADWNKLLKTNLLWMQHTFSPNGLIWHYQTGARVERH